MKNLFHFRAKDNDARCIYMVDPEVVEAAPSLPDDKEDTINRITGMIKTLSVELTENTKTPWQAFETLDFRDIHSLEDLENFSLDNVRKIKKVITEISLELARLEANGEHNVYLTLKERIEELTKQELTNIDVLESNWFRVPVYHRIGEDIDNVFGAMVEDKSIHKEEVKFYICTLGLHEYMKFREQSTKTTFEDPKAFETTFDYLSDPTILNSFHEEKLNDVKNNLQTLTNNLFETKRLKGQDFDELQRGVIHALEKLPTNSIKNEKALTALLKHLTYAYRFLEKNDDGSEAPELQDIKKTLTLKIDENATNYGSLKAQVSAWDENLTKLDSLD